MTAINVQVPDDASSLTHLQAQVEASSPLWTARMLAIARIGLGWIFSWAFLDKTFGLGFATENGDAWIRGGSPTNGFLSFATKGPFDGFYQSFAGAVWADWLFMIGLAGIGIALTAGILIRLAAISGAAMLIMMWSAALWPQNNPFMDDHLIYAIVLSGLALSNGGDTWGLGAWWKKLPTVRQYPALR